MTELMRDSLVLARNLGMDVFNALNLMQNQEFLQVRGGSSDTAKSPCTI